MGHKNRNPNLLLLPFAASRSAKLLKKGKMWRKRVGVEPTIHPAKGRIAGFEDREDHRTPCASVAIIGVPRRAINFCGMRRRPGTLPNPKREGQCRLRIKRAVLH